MKECFLIGIGTGAFSGLTLEAVKRIENAGIVAGAERILEVVGEDLVNGEWFCSYNSEEIAEKFEDFVSEKGNVSKSCCAVFSGDVGFYSGADRLSELLKEKGWSVHFVSGLSSVQMLASRLQRKWQDWVLVSAHGIDCNLGAELSPLSFGKSVFFLTGGKITAQFIVDFLIDKDYSAKVTVADRLSYADEKIISFNTLDLDKSDEGVAIYSSLENLELSVVLVEPSDTDATVFGSGALPDEVFERSTSKAVSKIVPMTKRVVRSAILSLLSIRDNEVVWDIGAGTGAVCVDLARSAKCSVYAIEKKDNALELERINRARFGALNLEIIEGKAPNVLTHLPKPDAVFIGGSDGALEGIVKFVLDTNPNARILVSSVTTETISKCVTISEKYELEFDVVQISVSQSSVIGGKSGKSHLMKAENPVSLISLSKI